ncbi:MAG: carboxymuconolactone decarboxylase family protein [Vicinamibacterales bacterium]|jgi:4-carboxymuconolactone decarboxylase|nr:carboxymuconolactone decarboxylase family protein [Vicinamibacterales bacterium]
MTKEQAAAVADFKATRNTTEFEGPFVPLLRSPELLRRAQRVGEYVRYHCALPSRLSEMAILIAARHWCQQYEWNVHAATATEAGLTAAVIDAIAEGRRPTDMAEDETALHDFCLELLRNQCVSDATYARAVALFDEQGVIDAIGILGYYQLLAMVMNTARTPLGAGMVSALERLPR